MNERRKIINDPVYGFVTINHPLLFKIIAHPYYQRLRRIHQMALAYLVYPGAVHTRLHHSLGAYHLMGNAITELKAKGTVITEEEEIAAKAAILLHDVGHGPFSHALENKLLKGVHHETLSLQIMKAMNEDLGGALGMAIDIFTNNYPKKFLHQLVSGQLDVDRMDYLTRDSFFTGVSEGVIGYDRIIKMLVVHNGELMVEEKGIYSIEKFLVARRQMYWQVYLHKTVLAAEKMLVNIIRRVRHLIEKGDANLATGTAVDFFLFDCDGTMGSNRNSLLQGSYQSNLALNQIATLKHEPQPYNNDTGIQNDIMDKETLQRFCLLDDIDFSFSVKKWALHTDKVLSELCNRLLNRKLLKVKIQSAEFNPAEIEAKTKTAAESLNISEEEASYFVFTGEANNTLYKTDDEKINILFKDGSVKSISSIDDALIHQTISSPVKKFYICSL